MERPPSLQFSMFAEQEIPISSSSIILEKHSLTYRKTVFSCKRLLVVSSIWELLSHWKLRVWCKNISLGNALSSIFRHLIKACHASGKNVVCIESSDYRYTLLNGQVITCWLIAVSMELPPPNPMQNARRKFNARKRLL